MKNKATYGLCPYGDEALIKEYDFAILNYNIKGLLQNI